MTPTPNRPLTAGDDAPDFVVVPGLRAANIARQAEWDPSDKITLTYRLNELAGETGEACNVGKKIERERLGIRGSRDTVEHLAEELADVVICADLVAMAEGIDLDAAIERKFNDTSEKVGLRTRLSLAARPAPTDDKLRAAVEALEPFALASERPVTRGIRREPYVPADREELTHGITWGHLRAAFSALAALKGEG